MCHVAVAHSDDIDTEDAAAELLAACEQRLDGHVPQAGLLFAGAEYDHQVLVDRIMARFPGLKLIGCTTDGEMSSAHGFTEDAITLALLSSDRIEFSVGVGERAGSEPHAAAAQAIAMARPGLRSEPKLALVLPDGLSASAFQVLDGFDAALGAGVPVVGGMSADRVGGNRSSYRTHQFFGRRVMSDSVPTLLLGGDLLFSLGVESGWSPVGATLTVTRSEANLLHELDGRPALDLYTHYLGKVMHEDLAGLGSYPLAVYEQGLDRFYLRVPSRADPGTGAIHFLGEVPEGAQVRITQAIRDAVIDGVERSAAVARSRYPGEAPGFAMLFSCTGRKIVLGTKTAEEVGRACAELPDALPVCGFYTFGEIGPVADHCCARYHNTTFVTLLIGTH
jgi:hypothetical protein